MKIGISYQVSIIIQMSSVIQFTNMSHSSSLWLFFEVSTNAFVVHVAEKLTVIQILNFFCIDDVVYKPSFSKKEVIGKQQNAITFWNKTIERKKVAIGKAMIKQQVYMKWESLPQDS